MPALLGLCHCASSPTSVVRGGVISPECGGQLSHGGGASSPAVVSIKGQNQLFWGQWWAARLSMALEFQYTWFLWPFLETWVTDFITDPSCSRNTDLDVAPGSSLCLDITNGHRSSIGPPDWHDPVAAQPSNTNMTKGCGSFRGAFMWSLVVSWTTNINTEPGCGSATDPDMFLISSLGPDVTLAQGGSEGPSDWHGSSGSMTLRYQHSLRWWSRLLALEWTLMVSEAMDINPDPDYGRAMDQDMAQSCSPGPAATVIPGGKQATKSAYPSQPLPLRICFLPQNTNHLHLFVSYFSTIYLLIIMAPHSTCHKVPGGLWRSSGRPAHENPGFPMVVFHSPVPHGIRRACGCLQAGHDRGAYILAEANNSKPENKDECFQTVIDTIRRISRAQWFSRAQMELGVWLVWEAELWDGVLGKRSG